MQSRSISNITRITAALAVSLLLAFMPFTVNLGKYRISLERNEAHAIAPVFLGASAFLTEMATAAGFASAGEFVATIVGATAVGSGMVLATDAGVRYGTEASQNLNNLIDAADYPDWNTLSQSEQESWGSKDNYDSAKFNSLMSAYGLSDAYGRYQSAWGSGGAGNFSFSSDEQSKLEQIGEIGENWANGAANTVDSILSIFSSNSHQVFNDYVGISDYTEFDATGINGWPNNVRTTLVVNQGAIFRYQKDGSTSIEYIKASQPVYIVLLYNTGNNRLYPYFFSKGLFQIINLSGTNPDVEGAIPNQNAEQKSYNGETYYSYMTPKSTNGSGYSTNMQVNNDSNSNEVNAFITAEYFILYGDVAFPEYDKMQDYPQLEIEEGTLNNTAIYFPENGIDDSTSWDELLQHQQNIDNNLEGVITLLRHIDSDLHNFSFYNDGQLKVHDEGVFTELGDIYALLMEMSGKMGNWGDIADAPDIIGDFDFDEIDDKIPNLLDTIKDLAPFGSLLLLSEIYTILANFTQIEEPVMTFPFNFGGLPGQDTDIEIDLSWLNDIKPVINFFCILMLLLAITNATIRIVELEAAS